MLGVKPNAEFELSHDDALNLMKFYSYLEANHTGVTPPLDTFSLTVNPAYSFQMR